VSVQQQYSSSAAGHDTYDKGLPATHPHPLNIPLRSPTHQPTQHRRQQLRQQPGVPLDAGSVDADFGVAQIFGDQAKQGGHFGAAAAAAAAGAAAGVGAAEAGFFLLSFRGSACALEGSCREARGSVFLASIGSL